MSQETAAPAATTEAPPAAATQAPAEGLFPTLVKTQAPASSTPPADSPAEDWFVMEGVKGTGKRPEYFDNKYNTLADQAKAYKELASKLGMRAPEKYDLSKFSDFVDESNEHVAGVIRFAREKNLGQDVVEGIFDSYAKLVSSNKVDYAKEIEKLGQGGRQKIETVAQWASNTLSEAAINTINSMGHTADFINLLDELRQFHSYSNQAGQPPGVTAAPAPFKVETVAEIEADILAHPDDYVNNAAFRAEINARLRRATGE